MAGEIDPKFLLALNAHPKIGSQTLKKILTAFPDPAEIWQGNPNIISKILDPKLAALVVEVKSQFNPDEELKKLQKYDVGYMTMYDKSFPRLLLEAPDCPAILYIRGNQKVLDLSGIGVVGSRKYTSYGRKISYALSKECAENGLAIFSGLALGIDAFAHQAALDADGVTVGVLGCGLDHIYPVSNFNLAKSIIEHNGAVISEFPLGTPPMKYNFPARNRIIAGLSLGILVIEAAAQSGALITAYQALEYNREVFAVPGNIDSETSAGTNKLIQSGAKSVLTVEDILSELKIERKLVEKQARKILPETKEEKTILDLLSQNEKSADELVRESGLNIILINSTLSVLEMKGFVSNLGGGRFRKN